MLSTYMYILIKVLNGSTGNKAEGRSPVEKKMSVTYNPNTPWPLPVLAKFLEVRHKLGYHEIYENGYVRNGEYDVPLSTFGKIVTFWTCRIFMLRVDMEQLGAVHLINDNGYYSKVEIHKNYGSDLVYVQKNSSGEKREVLVTNVNTGDIFSFALRVIAKKTLAGLANNKESQWNSLGGIIYPNKCRLKIWSSNHVVLSMHITLEEVQDTIRAPNPYLPPGFLDPEFSEQPTGSSMIVKLKLENLNEELNFGLQIDKKEEYIRYGQRKYLGLNSDIYVYVRNSPDSIVMSTNFEPAPRTIPHISRTLKFLRPDPIPITNIIKTVLLDK
ncbi:hypothetical protein MTO96_002241 [Rhipicephalus appendiculatus]